MAAAPEVLSPWLLLPHATASRGALDAVFDGAVSALPFDTSVEVTYHNLLLLRSCASRPFDSGSAPAAL